MSGRQILKIVRTKGEVTKADVESGLVAYPGDSARNFHVVSPTVEFRGAISFALGGQNTGFVQNFPDCTITVKPSKLAPNEALLEALQKSEYLKKAGFTFTLG